MKIRLGYVSICTAIDKTASKTVSFKNYTELGVLEGNKKIDETSLSNIGSLKEILNYNIRNNIHFYRMTSRLIPLGTHKEVSTNLNKFKNELESIGLMIKKNHLRVDTHPDQFCVLNSLNNDVIKMSVNILKHHLDIFKLMNISSRTVLHIGSGTPNKKYAITRFINTFNELDKDLREMIILENDDKVFTALDILLLCEKLNIPMVLDYHHHMCNNNGDDIEDLIDRIFKTWGNDIPKIHFSSPKNQKEKRSHHDYIDCDNFITFIEKIKFVNKDIDIMIEAKMKDEALFRLVRQLRYKTNYEFIDETSFIV